MNGVVMRTNVFVSYSRSDLKWLKRLQVHLKPLVEEGLINLWDDTRIEWGEEWNEKIERALAKTAVAIVLVSADFWASDYIAKKELPYLMQAAERGALTLLPVIVGPSLFPDAFNLGRLQIGNCKKPLSALSPARQDKVWVRLTARIRSIARSGGVLPKWSMRGKPAGPPALLSWRQRLWPSAVGFFLGFLATALLVIGKFSVFDEVGVLAYLIFFLIGAAISIVVGFLYVNIDPKSMSQPIRFFHGLVIAILLNGLVYISSSS